MNRLRLRAEGGFTLIELLVVIAIIGILAAIAIPQFATYRKKGFVTDVKSNLRNAATAQEAYFVDKNTYVSGALASGTPPGFNESTNVAVAAAIGTNTYLLTATHANCGSAVWTFVSTTGAITEPTTGCP